MKELNKSEEEESNKIHRLLKALLDKEKEITEHQTNIGNIKQYASELQTFLSLKHMEKDVLAAEKYIQSMVKSDGSNQVDFSCMIDSSLQGSISTIQTFGDVVVTIEQCKISILKQKDRQAQMIVAVTPMTIDSITPKMLQTLDKTLPFVFGCSFLPDRRMILVCLINKLITVFMPDGSLNFDIGNVGPVFDMTYIGENSVAVTSGYKSDSLQINIID